MLISSPRDQISPRVLVSEFLPEGRTHSRFYASEAFSDSRTSGYCHTLPASTALDVPQRLPYPTEASPDDLQHYPTDCVDWLYACQVRAEPGSTAPLLGVGDEGFQARGSQTDLSCCLQAYRECSSSAPDSSCLAIAKHMRSLNLEQQQAAKGSQLDGGRPFTAETTAAAAEGNNDGVEPEAPLKVSRSRSFS